MGKVPVTPGTFFLVSQLPCPLCRGQRPAKRGDLKADGQRALQASAPDTDPISHPLGSLLGGRLGKVTGGCVPWILSAVDVGLGALFEARSSLNVLAEVQGDPRLGESGWDTARSISCWPESTMSGQQVPEPAAPSPSLRAPAGSAELGSGQQRPEDHSGTASKWSTRKAWPGGHSHTVPRQSRLHSYCVPP